jgi:hypothetical protein
MNSPAGEYYARLTSSLAARYRLESSLVVIAVARFILVERTLWTARMFDIGSWLLVPFPLIFGDGIVHNFIRQKCIEANPQIVELKFGCEVQNARRRYDDSYADCARWKMRQA